MGYSKIKSYAKINLALNIVGKNSNLHKIESIISFLDMYDEISIKSIKNHNHQIKFNGKFSANIYSRNTISKLFEVINKKKLIKNKKFKIIIKKNIPSRAGLGGGSMNAANVLKFLVKKKIIKVSNKELFKICNEIGSDVILGMFSNNLILKSNNKIRVFGNKKSIYTLVVKPSFGCSTKDIYSKVKGFTKPQFDKPNKRIFNMNYLKKLNNSLEPIVLSNYKILRKIKSFLENLPTTEFVRITGSGSAIVAYFQSKEKCDKAKNQFNKKYKNYWCIASKTI